MADNSTQNRDELNALSKKFSISNFLTDLPRMLNDAFDVIVKYILKFYDPDRNSIKVDKLDATYIDTTTIVAQNLRFKGSNGVIYNYEDIGSILDDIQKKIAEFSHITKDQIDSLNTFPLQGWPLYADYYNYHPTDNIPENCVVLTGDGIDVYEFDCDAEDYVWSSKNITDQSIYVCGADWNIYQYNKDGGFWKNLGKYSEYC